VCVCGFARGQDAAGIPSVLTHGQTSEMPTLAEPTVVETQTAATETAPAVVAAAPAVTAAAPVVVVAEPTRCRNGRCCTGPNCRLYNVEESVSESCRPRLFGGYVKTNTARTVYRPARRR
jgi:hypothetical protein